MARIYLVGNEKTHVKLYINKLLTFLEEQQVQVWRVFFFSDAFLVRGGLYLGFAKLTFFLKHQL